MKKILTYILCLAGFMAASCKPDVYTGPLDSPVGNWMGIRSQYLFNGEQVADIDSCETTAISFYKQGLCCIEGKKGAFPYIYDHETGQLQIDNSLWQVLTLTGAEVVMQYLYTAYPPEETPEAAPAAESSQDGPESDPATEGSETTPGGSETTPDGSEDGTEETPDTPEEPKEPEVPEVKPDANGVILPAEYKGFTITADENGYFYKNSADETVYCYFKGWKDESGSLIIDFWYDSHIDHLIPLVAPATKK